jgi:hypothetical protein
LSRSATGLRRRIRRQLHLTVVDATSGALALFGTLMCMAALALAVLLKAPDMLPGWADPLNLALTSALIFAPVSGGIAAVHAGNLNRSRMLDLAATCPNGQWRALVRAGVGVFSWAVLALAIFTIVVLVGADLQGPVSAAMWLLPTQALMLIGAAATLGTAVGARLTWYLTGPVTTLVLYGVLFRLDVSGARLSPVYTDIYYQVRFEPNVRLLLAVHLALAAVMVFVAALALRTTRTLTKAVGVLGAVACAGLCVAQLGAAAPGDTQLREGGSGTCSTRSHTRLCVWPENSERLDAALGALVEVTEAARPVMPVVENYEEPGLRGGDAAHLYVMPGFGEDVYLGAAVSAVVPAPCDSRTAQVAFELQALIYERLDPGSSAPALGAAAIAQNSLAAQREWAGERLRQLAACTPHSRGGDVAATASSASTAVGVLAPGSQDAT